MIYNVTIRDTTDTDNITIDLLYYVTIHNNIVTYEIKENKLKVKKSTFNSLISNINYLCYLLSKKDIKKKVISNFNKEITIQEV